MPNVSAIILATGMACYPQQLCQFRQIFVLLGLVLINGTLLAKHWQLGAYCHECRYVTRKRRKNPALFNLQHHENELTNVLAEISGKIRRITVFIVSVAALLLVIWLSSDPAILKTSIFYKKNPLYNIAEDTYYVRPSSVL